MVSASTGKIPQVAPYSGDMFPIVARSASGRVARPGPKNSTNLPTTPRARSISVTVSTRSVAVAPSGSSPVSRKPTTCGSSIEIGCPSIAASASIPPTPQPSTPRPLIIVAGEVLEVHLVADAGVRRDDREVVERLLAPAQELVALAVALELELGVRLEGVAQREDVDLDRVVDHELGGNERVD